MRHHDQQFFDSFMLVIGILIGVAVGLILLARAVQLETQSQFVLEDPVVQAAIEERIRPIGEVALIGEVEQQAAAAPAAVTPEQVEAPMSGPQVFNTTCYLCHSAPGVGGAPVVGDASAWGPRIEQGLDVLVQHAIGGFQGDAGFMPPKGGRVDLSDDEVRAAVEYMVEQVQQ